MSGIDEAAAGTSAAPRVPLIRPEACVLAVMGELGDMIVNLDARGTIQWVSPDVRNVLGYDPDDVIGMNAVAFLPERDVSK